jgi:phospholipid/cholesterol/gamma-HCH transport system substrate-binding protein
LRLQPREDKYYLLEIIDDPRGRTTTKTVVTQTNDPNLPPVVHETSSTTSEGIKVSFQFAKQWYFLTGRFGIFEGSGGLGMDFEFFNKRLKLTADAFDFTADEEPRIRFLASYEFLKHFYFTAGLDDLLNRSRIDYFVGTGLRFTDDDLKAILTVAPTLGL